MPKRRKAQRPRLHIYPEPPLPVGWSESFLSADSENDSDSWGYHVGLNAPTAGIDFWDLPDGYATPRQIKEAMQEHKNNDLWDTYIRIFERESLDVE